MAAVLVAALVAALVTPASAAAAPGCPAGRPTRVGGTIRGYPDGRALNTHIGLALTDRPGHLVTVDGAPAGGYAAVFKLNPDYPPTGLATGEVNWGTCVAATVTQAFAEAYPKRPGEITDLSRYGRTAYYRQPVTPGATVSMGLRLPVTWQADHGNTGGVHGYVWYQGHRVPPSAITRVRAFPYNSGSACGIEGYSAAADQLVASTDGLRTYYLVDYLAGGQCGALTQPYSLQLDCTAVCGKATASVNLRVGVARGRWPRLDIHF